MFETMPTSSWPFWKVILLSAVILQVNHHQTKILHIKKTPERGKTIHDVVSFTNIIHTNIFVIRKSIIIVHGKSTTATESSCVMWMSSQRARICGGTSVVLKFLYIFKIPFSMSIQASKPLQQQMVSLWIRHQMSLSASIVTLLKK